MPTYILSLVLQLLPQLLLQLLQKYLVTSLGLLLLQGVAGCLGPDVLYFINEFVHFLVVVVMDARYLGLNLLVLFGELSIPIFKMLVFRLQLVDRLL